MIPSLLGQFKDFEFCLLSVWECLTLHVITSFLSANMKTVKSIPLLLGDFKDFEFCLLSIHECLTLQEITSFPSANIKTVKLIPSLLGHLRILSSVCSLFGNVSYCKKLRAFHQQICNLLNQYLHY